MTTSIINTQVGTDSFFSFLNLKKSMITINPRDCKKLMGINPKTGVINHCQNNINIVDLKTKKIVAPIRAVKQPGLLSFNKFIKYNIF